VFYTCFTQARDGQINCVTLNDGVNLQFLLGLQSSLYRTRQ